MKVGTMQEKLYFHGLGDNSVNIQSHRHKLFNNMNITKIVMTTFI